MAKKKKKTKRTHHENIIWKDLQHLSTTNTQSSINNHPDRLLVGKARHERLQTAQFHLCEAQTHIKLIYGNRN